MERRPFSFLTFDTDGAAVRAYHVFDDLGPEAGSTRFAADRPIGEQTVADLRRHAVARINDGDPDCGSGGVAAASYRDGAARRDFGNGVVDEIVERVEEPVFIGPDDGEIVEPVGPEHHLPFIGEDAQRVDDTGDDVGHATRGKL